MQTYDDKPIKDINWAKYKIIVPTEKDRKELMEAFEHLHYTDCDTNFVPVNQLIHEYLCEEVTGDPKSINNIIVDGMTYDKLTINNFDTMVDELTIFLTEFQKAYIKEINYFNEFKGECKMLLGYSAKKYKKVITEEELIKEIDELIDNDIILVTTKKYIFNGNWKTDKLINVNYKIIDKLHKNT